MAREIKTKFKNHASEEGFTLIELLVVISIIGLLASVVLVSVSQARTRARDTYRKASLRQIQTALSLYYDDHDSTYPITFVKGAAHVYFSESATGGTSQDHPLTGPTGWVPGLAPQYLGQLPADPLHHALNSYALSVSSTCTSNNTGFIYISDGYDYKVLDFCGSEHPVPSSDPFYDAFYDDPVAAGPFYIGTTLSFSTPGAVGW